MRTAIRIGHALAAAAMLAPCSAARAAGTVEPGTPGRHYDISFSSLPAPFATKSTNNGPATVARPAGAVPKVPAGFRASLFAGNLSHARWLAVAANGDVFLAESNAGKVTLLRDADGDGRAEKIATFADGFQRPHGLAFHDGALYVGDARGAWRLAYKDGDEKATGAPARVTPEGAFGDPRGNHWTRNLAFDSKGRLFVSIGSASNVNEEPLPRASVQMFENGKQTTYASGLRNPVGIAFYPGTDDLYTVVNERDLLGDGLVPDYLTRVDQNAFYGWPYAYLGPHPDPTNGAKRPDLVKSTKAPDVLFQAHSAALGILFYQGTQFPAAYRGGAFVTFHGSWNAGQPTGYKVVYVPFENRRPKGGYDDFATGFWIQGTEPAQVWGRPVGLAMARDGSLLVADDAGNAVWRISYSGN